uniref:Uncharacterized protein n=1 Tax=Opuntia streptacantha TaxID=393608 RepID=A0A7C8YN61_OPUST
MSLIRIFSEGPEVSLSGSPMTAALCGLEPFGPRALACSEAPASIYFLALSHAPPVLDADMAIWTPETREPARTPERVSTPKNMPTMSGMSMTKAPGGTISLIEASVEILTQVA